MQIHWSRWFPGLGEPLRAEAELRLHRLALGHRDLTDARVGAEAVHSHGSSVRVQIRGLVRGHPLASTAEHGELERALGAALDDFEREVHELRDRRRTLHRQPRAASPQAWTAVQADLPLELAP